MHTYTHKRQSPQEDTEVHYRAGRVAWKQYEDWWEFKPCSYIATKAKQNKTTRRAAEEGGEGGRGRRLAT